MAREAHMGKKYTIPNGKGLALQHFYLASCCGQDSVGRRLKRLETMDLGWVNVCLQGLRVVTYLDRLCI